jgi:phenylacetaldehyde dehydrogenase
MSTLPETINLIDGDVLAPVDTLPGELTNPATGEVIGERTSSSPTQIELALDAASRVHDAGLWYHAGPEFRAAALRSFADRVDEYVAEMAMADALNSGVLHGITTAMASGAGDRLRASADQLLSVGQDSTEIGRGGGPVLRCRAPWGPAIIIGPWNAPLATVIGKIASALAAGNPVILKPSEWAPSSAHYLVKAALDAGLPPGVFQVVHGAGVTGAHLVSDPRIGIVSFTGSSTTARAIAMAGAPHFTRLQLEASGNNPVIVCADADLDRTTDALVDGIIKLNGQWCEGPGKVLVNETVYDELLDRLTARLGGIAIGSNFDDSTQLGPLSHQSHRDQLSARVDELVAHGGTAHSNGDLPPDGWFIAPTIVSGINASDATAELFGPVVTVHPVTDDDVAVQTANGAGDGLGGYVFSSDTERALAIGSRMRAGEIKINGTSLLDLVSNSRQSFWGTSGYGGHTTLADELELFRGDRIVGIDNPNAPI